MALHLLLLLELSLYRNSQKGVESEKDVEKNAKIALALLRNSQKGVESNSIGYPFFELLKS